MLPLFVATHLINTFKDLTETRLMLLLRGYGYFYNYQQQGT